MDAFQVGGKLSAGGVNIGVGYQDDDMNTRAGASIGGSFGAIGWELGFETDDPDNGSEDTTNAGFFADYDLGPGAAYFYLADAGGAVDDTAWTVGYSHGLGVGRQSRRLSIGIGIRMEPSRSWRSWSVSDRILPVVSCRKTFAGRPSGRPVFIPGTPGLPPTRIPSRLSEGAHAADAGECVVATQHVVPRVRSRCFSAHSAGSQSAHRLQTRFRATHESAIRRAAREVHFHA